MATYDQIKKANATIRTTDVRGKEYAEVNQRVRAFRMVWPNGYIKTDMVSNFGDIGKHTVIFRAEVGYTDEAGDHLLATGTAYENEGSTNINRTSYIENCETSAVGRALGFLGFGVDVAIASAEEVKQAIAAQEAPQSAQEARRATEAPQADIVTAEQVKTLSALLTANGLKLEDVLHHYSLGSVYDMDGTQYADAIERVKKWAQRCRRKKEEEA